MENLCRRNAFPRSHRSKTWIQNAETYAKKVESVAPIETQPTAEELENERLAESKKAEFLKFSESEEGIAFTEKYGKKAYVAWLKPSAIKENPLIKDILSL